MGAHQSGCRWWTHSLNDRMLKTVWKFRKKWVLFHVYLPNSFNSRIYAIAPQETVGWNVNTHKQRGVEVNRRTWNEMEKTELCFRCKGIMQFGAVCHMRGYSARNRVTQPTQSSSEKRKKTVLARQDTRLSISYCLEFIARAYGNKEKSNPTHKRIERRREKNNSSQERYGEEGPKNRWLENTNNIQSVAAAVSVSKMGISFSSRTIFFCFSLLLASVSLLDIYL